MLIMSPVLPSICLVSVLLFSDARCTFAAPTAKPNAPVSKPSSYLRVREPATNVVELQIALRKFIPVGKPGTTIWLSGVAHIGDTNYYHTLQKHLAEQSLVLFEGVNGGKRITNSSPQKPEAHSSNPPKPDPSLQSNLAVSLGLAFQLDTIDYKQKNFRNSDLSIEQLQKLMTDDKATAAEFQSMLKMMDGSSLFSLIFQGGLKLISSSPRMRDYAKLTLIETLGNAPADLGQMRGMTPSMKQLMKIIVETRNEAVLKDIKAEIQSPKPPKTISIFYGAGHMDHLETLLSTELGYKPAGEIWHSAIQLDIGKSGISASEVRFYRALIRSQFEKLAPKPNP